MKRVLIQFGIALFFFWHSFAIAVYSLPDTVEHPKILRYHDTAMKVVRPYMLMTSQWQQWNLFSPDPLRNVTQYKVETYTEGRWIEEFMIAPNDMPVGKRSSELKMLRRLHEKSQYDDLLERYAQMMCDEVLAAPGDIVRITEQSAIIPKDLSPASFSTWKSRNLEFKDASVTSVECP